MRNINLNISKKDDVSSLEKALEGDVIVCYDFLASLIKHGSINCLKYLRENVKRVKTGLVWDSHLCRAAAKFSQLKILKYLRDEKCPWDSDVYHSAICNGDMEMFEYLISENCPWDTSVSCVAARSGNLEFLIPLYEKGCPCDESALFVAGIEGKLKTFEYLYENGFLTKRELLPMIIENEKNLKKIMNFLEKREGEKN
jgi:hypothetical protein